MEFDLIDINAEIAEAEEARLIIRRAPKVYLQRIDPFQLYDNKDFKRRYRIRKDSARQVVDLIRNDIEAQSSRGKPISAELQLLATLRYLAKGAYEEDIADQHGMSQPTLSNVIKRVVEAIARHHDRYIRFPEGVDLERTKEDFYRIANCPSIVGAIDCTHIKIKCPGGENPLIYINRKGYYSLNVQVVCNSDCKITNIVARWRGSAHDSRIWNSCSLKRKFERGEVNGILLGDNGYPCSRYILTPLLNPVTEAEIRYNRAHIRTRNVVERAFGQWKNKFRCFFNGMHLKLQTAKAAIVALAILHNISVSERQNEENSDSDEENDVPGNEDVNGHDNDIQGNIFRRQYIQRHFN